MNTNERIVLVAVIGVIVIVFLNNITAVPGSVVDLCNVTADCPVSHCLKNSEGTYTFFAGPTCIDAFGGVCNYSRMDAGYTTPYCVGAFP